MRKKNLLATLLGISTLGLAACGSGSDRVIVYSNADDEAIEVMRTTLDENGYDGQYEIQTFGTSELGGRLLAEGNAMEADLLTMSTFYLTSAEDQNDMLAPLEWDVGTLEELPDYAAPMTVQEGAVIVNDQMVEEMGVEVPQSIADLADSRYEGMVSVVDIDSSSTAWLMIQALISRYGEEEATDILAGIYRNAGDHIETSGSGPLNKVKAGEVPFGFGLRHQVLSEQEQGIPLSIVDPEEGNFMLTESVAVVDKEDSEKESLAQEMSQVIIEEGRPEIQEYYPAPLYEGETVNEEIVSDQPKVFEEDLTAELLAEHQAISDQAKQQAAQ